MSFFKKPEEEIVAVFDIGNGSVGGALVKLEAHRTPIILYAHREPISFASQPSAELILSSMLKMLQSVAENLTKEGMSHIKLSFFGSHKLRDAYCVFASPWYISQTKVVREEKDSPFLISSGAMADLVKKEQDNFNKEIKEGKYERIFGPDTQLLEKKIVEVKLNGYEIHNPAGKRAKELELTMFSSFISKEIIDSVEGAIHKAFAVRSINHSSYGFVSWHASRILFPDIHDHFFFDVSSETTDISLVSRDVLIETISFPMGKSELLRRVVKEINVSPDVALSSLSMHFSGHSDDKFKEKIGAIINPISEEWHSACIEALKNFQKIYALPKAAFVTADLDTSKFFLSSLEKEFPAELNIVGNRLSINFIGADTIQRFVEILPGALPASFMAIESIFFNSIFSKQDKSN